MAENAPDGLEGLMMGNVSEEVAESDEQIQARIAAAQARVAQIKKDESSAHSFDDQLAKLIQALSPRQLDFVIFMINHEIPSLTILACLSIVSDVAETICHQTFAKDIKQKADVSTVGFSAEVEQKVSYWWTFIYAADHVSKTTRLKELGSNTKFVQEMSRYSIQFLHQFLQQEKADDFSDAQLKRILQQYQGGLFA